MSRRTVVITTLRHKGTLQLQRSEAGESSLVRCLSAGAITLARADLERS